VIVLDGTDFKDIPRDVQLKTLVLLFAYMFTENSMLLRAFKEARNSSLRVYVAH